MRRGVLVLVAVGLVVAAGIAGVSVGSQVGHHQAAAPEQRGAAADTQNSPAPASTIPPLTPAGSEIYVDVPATITLVDTTGRTVYLQATVGELSTLGPADTSSTLAALPALAGYTEIYQAPVTVRLLAAPTNTAQLNGATLSAFTLAVRPGQDPPLSTDTLTTTGCAAAPSTAVHLGVGQELTWCVHAFRRPDAPAPIGAQYQTAAGVYSSPLIWASKTYSDNATIG